MWLDRIGVIGWPGPTKSYNEEYHEEAFSSIELARGMIARRIDHIIEMDRSMQPLKARLQLKCCDIDSLYRM